MFRKQLNCNSVFTKEKNTVYIYSIKLYSTNTLKFSLQIKNTYYSASVTVKNKLHYALSD